MAEFPPAGADGSLSVPEAFLGGGGLSGLIAAQLTVMMGLQATFAISGTLGVFFALIEIWRRGGSVLTEIRSV